MENHLIFYIEALRKKRHITLFDFIDQITSERSYRRYVRNEKSIPFDTLSKLVERLELSLADLLEIIEIETGKKSLETKIETYALEAIYQKDNALMQKALEAFEVNHSKHFEFYKQMIAFHMGSIQKTDYESFINHIDMDAFNKSTLIVIEAEQLLLNYSQESMKTFLGYFDNVNNLYTYNYYLVFSLMRLVDLYEDIILKDFKKAYLKTIESIDQIDVVYAFSEVHVFILKHLLKVAKIKKDQALFDVTFFEYLNMIKILKTNDEQIKRKKEVSDIFGIDLHDFMSTYFKDHFTKLDK